MNQLKKREEGYYTQNRDDLPIEQRVFFREGKGVTATNEHYRVATDKEVEEWQNWQKEQEEKYNL